ncbi:hypothetical protein STEG23_023605, partial [Scotinomys teguina]
MSSGPKKLESDASEGWWPRQMQTLPLVRCEGRIQKQSRVTVDCGASETLS